MTKTIYYKDELNDDFANNKIVHKGLPLNYTYYSSNIIWRFNAWFVYHFIVKPLVWVIEKFYLNHRFVGKRKLKSVKGSYFIYSNHTNDFSDAVMPALSNFKKKAYIIANSDCVNIRGIRELVKMVGGVPLPDTLDESKKFKRRLDDIIASKDVIAIYPEAHIWPYYTDIRPFSDTSFKYPVKYNLPVFTITNCYKKRLIGKRPRMVSYIDGPFYPNASLGVKESTSNLRDTCYNQMKDRVINYSKYQYVNYVKQV